MRLASHLDAVLLDIGGTLVVPAPPATAVSDLRTVLYPGVAEGLEALAAQVPLAAVTNTAVMREPAVRALLAQGGIERYFAAVVTSADVGREKPDPAPVQEALRRLGGVVPHRALFVGDAEVDRLAAHAAGCPFQMIGPEGLWAVVQHWLAERSGRRFQCASAAVAGLDEAAMAAARDRQNRLTKPAGSLGRLEAVSVRLAGMAGECPPPLPHPAAAAVFVADHGVALSGVTPWPQEVTTAMAANFASGGAAVNVIARQVGASLTVVDVGMAGPPVDGILGRRVADGTADLSHGPAMAGAEARAALDVGVEMADTAVNRGARCLIAGEMGIGNTTPSAALIGAFTGRPAEEVTGRGTGIDDAMLTRKVEVVASAIGRAGGLAPLEALAEIGGLEIAAIAGYVVGGAAARVPVVLDGLISLAGAVVAQRLCPGVASWCIAGHRSPEPGATAALEELGLTPLLDLGLRLGEGTGALLAYPLITTAAALLAEMATFDPAGVPGLEA